MREQSHITELERWAEFVKENPKVWKKKLKPFLDSQILMSRRFYKKLSETEDGRKKLLKLRNLSS